MSIPKDFHAVTRHLEAAASARGDDTPTDNLRTLQAQIDAIARGDLAVVMENSCDDVTLEMFVPPDFPFVRSAVGATAFRQALETNFAAVGNQKPVIVDLFSEGDKVVLFGRETGVIQTTGATYDIEFVQRFTFRDGCLAAVQIIGAHARPVGE